MNSLLSVSNNLFIISDPGCSIQLAHMSLMSQMNQMDLVLNNTNQVSVVLLVEADSVDVSLSFEEAEED